MERQLSGPSGKGCRVGESTTTSPTLGTLRRVTRGSACGNQWQPITTNGTYTYTYTQYTSTQHTCTNSKGHPKRELWVAAPGREPTPTVAGTVAGKARRPTCDASHSSKDSITRSGGCTRYCVYPIRRSCAWPQDNTWPGQYAGARTGDTKHDKHNREEGQMPLSPSHTSRHTYKGKVCFGRGGG